MPTKPAIMCRKPGCRGIVKDGRCSVCGPQAARIDGRPNSRQRGYDSRWNKIAATHKACKPLCEVCEAEGRVTIATLSHHLKAVSNGGAVHVAQDELLAVCTSCHQKVEGLGREWRRAVKRNDTTPQGGWG